MIKFCEPLAYLDHYLTIPQRQKAQYETVERPNIIPVTFLILCD